MVDVYQFIVGLVTILIIDAVYLSLAIPRLYKPGMIEVARPVMETRHLVAGFLTWPVIILGLQILVLPRARSADEAFKFGAAFGAASYAIYNLTNYATIRVPGHMSVIDTVWGSVLSGTVARVMYQFSNRQSF